jgi:hypothetical protein
MLGKPSGRVKRPYVKPQVHRPSIQGPEGKTGTLPPGETERFPVPLPFGNAAPNSEIGPS